MVCGFQVTEWLKHMLTQQLMPSYGDIGEDLISAQRLTAAHDKFTENATKTYK